MVGFGAGLCAGKKGVTGDTAVDTEVKIPTIKVFKPVIKFIVDIL